MKELRFSSLPRALLLDAGNTCVFLDYEAVAEVLERVVSTEALARAEPVAKRRYEEDLGAGLSHADGWGRFMARLVEAAGLPLAEAEASVPRLRAAHDAFNLWRRVPEDLPAALSRARAAGVATGIVSNSEGKLAELFERLGIARWFDVVLDSGVEGVQKPAPEIFERALTRLGVRAEDAVYAGDIVSVDVEGARRAGMRAVLVDPFDHYAGVEGVVRVKSVAEIVDAMLVGRRG